MWSGIDEINEIVSRVVMKVSDSRVMADVDATVAWAGKSGKADIARLGIPGSAGAGASCSFMRTTARDSKRAWRGMDERREREKDKVIRGIRSMSPRN
jgi:dienelactone hydrolase